MRGVAQSIRISTFVLASSLFVTGSVQADVEIYGRLHLSSDYIKNGEINDLTIGSNGSRLGFKGSELLDEDLKAIWKIETQVDVTGEQSGFESRNQYLGLVNRYGMMLIGHHDTPFKSLGVKADMFMDTIGDERAIIGNGNGDNIFNVRARNMMMYISPLIAGMEFRAMRSTGQDTSDTSDGGAISSFSAIYKTRYAYAGLAFEDQALLETSGTRIGAGAVYGDFELNGLYEVLDSSGNPFYDRAAYGGSVSYRMGDTTVKAQLFLADDYFGEADTGGALMALGASYKLGKPMELYALVAGTHNSPPAVFPLAAGAHGETYKPATVGGEIYGVSGGLIYNF